jgi:hypothetical protein
MSAISCSVPIAEAVAIRILGAQRGCLGIVHFRTWGLLA